MLVASKATKDYNVIAPEERIKKFISLIAPHIDDLPKKYFSTSNKNLHSPAWFSSIIHKQIYEIDPDIIHLHWVQGGALSIKEISKIKKPIVWTLHDMWPFSGAEHYSDNSERYKEGYKRYNRPKGESGFDLNRWVWNRKKKNLPEKISNKEIEINEIEKKLSDPNFYTNYPDEFVKISKELEIAKNDLDDYETRWLEIDQKKNNIL